jgi:hypothetical protein
MPYPEDRIYVSIIELDGVKHVQRLSTSAVGEELQSHARAAAGRAKLLEVRPVNDPAEIDTLASEILAQPDWQPITPLDLAHTESGPVEPAAQ